MTPIAARLQHHLGERRRWFKNQWFFPWHGIKSQHGVDVDAFDGRRIQSSGIEYSGSIVDMFWDAAVRGVRAEVEDRLAWLDEEVRRYNSSTRQRTLDEAAGQLVSFVETVRREAARTDALLRGNGINIPPPVDRGQWVGLGRAEIAARVREIALALPEAPRSDPAGAEPDSEMPLSIDSATWTGLPTDVTISAPVVQKMVAALDEIDRQIEAGPSNSAAAQAHAYAIAIRALLDAPDPQPDIVWEMLSRANNLAGVGSFFISLLALFVAAAH